MSKKTEKVQAVNMSALQNEFALASRDAKTKAKNLQLAYEADEAAKARLTAARDAFQAASRTVLVS